MTQKRIGAEKVNGGVSAVHLGARVVNRLLLSLRLRGFGKFDDTLAGILGREALASGVSGSESTGLQQEESRNSARSSRARTLGPVTPIIFGRFVHPWYGVWQPPDGGVWSSRVGIS